MVNPEEAPSYMWDIKYENYVDFFWMGHKRGMFALGFGQAMHTPPKLLVRLWMDIEGARSFHQSLGKWIESHEKTFEKSVDKGS